MSDPIAPLLDHLDALRSFVRQRIDDPELAADVLQDSLLKALRASEDLRAEERLLPWFYRILRHGIVDAYRSRGLDENRLAELRTELTSASLEDPEVAKTVCACLHTLLPALKPDYAELIREIDLGDTPPGDLAERLGITRNNLKVRHHRARAQLRKRLEESCRACAVHGCMDCTCAVDDAPSS